MFVLILTTFVRAEVPTTAPATYTNPLPVDMADPFVIHDHDLYWLYGTSSYLGFKCWSSPDLVHWEPRGLAFTRDKNGWGQAMFWAPCVVARHGKFYLYYSALGNAPGGQQHLRICVAMSDSPAGPFKDVKAPLLEIGKSTIDAETFVDDDGKAYLYYALDNSENIVRDPKNGKEIHQSHIYVVRLGDDLVSVVGAPVFCTKPDHKWEGDTVNEGPFVFKHDGTYILMYSAHAFFEPEYCLGYATATSPLGPWTKANKPVLWHTPTVSGPGHNCVIDSPDGKETFCVYHEHKNVNAPSGDRELAIDRMEFDHGSDGKLIVKVLGPTSTPQPMPSAVK
jgi:GH43 family beta-xylosidase